MDGDNYPSAPAEPVTAIQARLVPQIYDHQYSILLSGMSANPFLAALWRVPAHVPCVDSALVKASMASRTIYDPLRGTSIFGIRFAPPKDEAKETQALLSSKSGGLQRKIREDYGHAATQVCVHGEALELGFGARTVGFLSRASRALER